MKICDRCGGKPLALILLDKKDGQEWDLCHIGKEEFEQFMSERCKRKGRPRKDGED